MKAVSFTENDSAQSAESRESVSGGSGYAHGKVILIGEHTVVYDSAAVALPLPGAGVTARAGFVTEPTEPMHTPPRANAEIAQAVGAALEEWDPGGGAVHVSVDCRIPRGRGLGTSAAVVVAVLRATAALCRVHPSDAELARLAQIAEQVSHGRASGVDVAAALSRSPVVFRSGSACPAVIGTPLHVVVADSGTASSTADAVSRVAVRLAHTSGPGARILARSKLLVEAAVADLAAGRLEAFGRRLVDFHSVLSELGVSTPQLDRLVTVALAAGAAGAKLTGGGLGGCLIAVTGTQSAARRVEDALRTAGAAETWRIPIEGDRR